MLFTECYLYLFLREELFLIVKGFEFRKPLGALCTISLN